MNVLNLIGAVVVLLGSLFLFLGALGVVRMPDSYNRIQTGTKATTMGMILTVIGFSFLHPEWSGKLFLLVLFIVFTNPVSSHVLARAAHFVKIPMTKKTVVDKLKEKEKKQEGGLQ